MEFNKNWTKEDNDKLRLFIRENKSEDSIREYFTNNKLFYHPNKKYYLSGRSAAIPNFKNKILDFTGFINEIKYEPLKTEFRKNFKKSEYFIDEFDYNYKFKTYSGNLYDVDFIYMKDTIGPFIGRNLYNISFTLSENKNLNDYIEYERKTYLNEQHEIMKRLIFIILNFDDKHGKDCVYMLGETEDIRKINWYRNLIKDTFTDIIEIIGESSFTNGLNAYYFNKSI